MRISINSINFKVHIFIAGNTYVPLMEHYSTGVEDMIDVQELNQTKATVLTTVSPVVVVWFYSRLPPMLSGN